MAHAGREAKRRSMVAARALVSLRPAQRVRALIADPTAHRPGRAALDDSREFRRNTSGTSQQIEILR
ncbi:hypothetical protein ACFWY6_23250 [Streptomyces sp. NPDC059037]|uniref:hypothetical protein n=1 Tax=Streptomyces sp. NPDC059037 TaxID=3346710 RepID=UPI0036797875